VQDCEGEIGPIHRRWSEEYFILPAPSFLGEAERPKDLLLTKDEEQKKNAECRMQNEELTFCVQISDLRFAISDACCHPACPENADLKGRRTKEECRMMIDELAVRVQISDLR
jgi:hypothetical protein